MPEADIYQQFQEVGALMIQIIKGLPDNPTPEQSAEALEWIERAERILDSITE